MVEHRLRRSLMREAWARVSRSLDHEDPLHDVADLQLTAEELRRLQAAVRAVADLDRLAEVVVPDPVQVAAMGMVHCAKVYVAPSKIHGLGVFARDNYPAGEVLETGLMIRMQNVDGHENPHLHTWSDDRTVWGMSTGCICFYNHSDEPNVRKIGDLVRDTLVVVALRDIARDEELCNTYMSAPWRRCFADLKATNPQRD